MNLRNALSISKLRTQKTRAKWEEYFRLLLIQRKEREKENMIKMKDNRTKDRERVSEIWKTDILPNFHQHWDYETHLPKGVQEWRSKTQKEKRTKKSTTARRKSKSRNNKRSFLSFFTCRARGSPSPSPKRGGNIAIEDAHSEEESIKSICKGKSLLLYQVWRLGIPDWLRKTMWPITIGNRLEVTPNAV